MHSILMAYQPGGQSSSSYQNGGAFGGLTAFLLLGFRLWRYTKIIQRERGRTAAKKQAKRTANAPAAPPAPVVDQWAWMTPAPPPDPEPALPAAPAWAPPTAAVPTQPAPPKQHIGAMTILPSDDGGRRKR